MKSLKYASGRLTILNVANDTCERVLNALQTHDIASSMLEPWYQNYYYYTTSV